MPTRPNNLLTDALLTDARRRGRICTLLEILERRLLLSDDSPRIVLSHESLPDISSTTFNMPLAGSLSPFLSNPQDSAIQSVSISSLPTTPVNFSASGSGSQRVNFTDGTYQQIDYTLSVNFVLTAAPSGKIGNQFDYTVTAIQGPLHFSGQAFDSLDNFTFLFDNTFDYNQSTTGAGTDLLYSTVTHQVTSISFGLVTSSSNTPPSFVTYQRNGAQQTTEATIALPSRWYFDGLYDVHTANVVMTLPSVSGTVFADNNGNGVQNSGELNQAGVTVFADYSGTGALTTIDPQFVTDAAGNYTLDLPWPASWRIREVPPNGATIITPPSGYFDLTLAANQNISAQNFGNHASTKLSVLDRSSNNVTHVQVATLIDEPGVLNTDGTATADFNNLDHERFSLVLDNPTIPLSQSSLNNISVLSIGRDGTSVVDSLMNLKLDRQSNTRFASKSLILVADDQDDQFGGNEGTENDLTIKAEVGGKLRFSFTDSTGQLIENTVNVSDPQDIRQIRISAKFLNGLGLSDSSVQAFLKRANALFAQANIYFSAISTAAIDDPGALSDIHRFSPSEPYDDLNGNGHFDFQDLNGDREHQPGESSEPFLPATVTGGDPNGNGQYDGLELTDEERQLLGINRDSTFGTINAYFVHSLDGGAVAEQSRIGIPGFPDSGFQTLDDAGFVNSIIASIGIPQGMGKVVGHELMHILLNQGTHPQDPTERLLLTQGGTEADNGDDTLLFKRINRADGLTMAFNSLTLPVPVISVSPASVVEGNSGTTSLTFTVTLTNPTGLPLGSPVTVQYQTANKSASVADNDYLQASGSLTFSGSETQKSVTITVNGDSKYEFNDFFALALYAPTNAILGTLEAPGTIINDDLAPASVTGVFVRGVAWSNAFLSYLDTSGLGDAAFGYRIPTGTNQLKSLPWPNLNQISLSFNENVTITQAALSLFGLNLPTYNISSFTYNSAAHTATWTFATNFSTDKLQLAISSSAVTDSSGGTLDGDWTDASSTSSGNGIAGGNFAMHVNILPADANSDGIVDGADFDTWFTHLQQSTFNPAQGDLNADGLVDGADFDQWFTRLQSTLPFGGVSSLTSFAAPLAPTNFSSTSSVCIQHPELSILDDSPTKKPKQKLQKHKPLLIHSRLFR